MMDGFASAQRSSGRVCWIASCHEWMKDVNDNIKDPTKQLQWTSNPRTLRRLLRKLNPFVMRLQQQQLVSVQQQQQQQQQEQEEEEEAEGRQQLHDWLFRTTNDTTNSPEGFLSTSSSSSSSETLLITSLGNCFMEIALKLPYQNTVPLDLRQACHTMIEFACQLWIQLRALYLSHDASDKAQTTTATLPTTIPPFRITPQQVCELLQRQVTIRSFLYDQQQPTSNHHQQSSIDGVRVAWLDVLLVAWDDSVVSTRDISHVKCHSSSSSSSCDQKDDTNDDQATRMMLHDGYPYLTVLPLLLEESRRSLDVSSWDRIWAAVASNRATSRREHSTVPTFEVHALPSLCRMAHQYRQLTAVVLEHVTWLSNGMTLDAFVDASMPILQASSLSSPSTPMMMLWPSPQPVQEQDALSVSTPVTLSTTSSTKSLWTAVQILVQQYVPQLIEHVLDLVDGVSIDVLKENSHSQEADHLPPQPHLQPPPGSVPTSSTTSLSNWATAVALDHLEVASKTLQAVRKWLITTANETTSQEVSTRHWNFTGSRSTTVVVGAAESSQIRRHAFQLWKAASEFNLDTPCLSVHHGRVLILLSSVYLPYLFEASQTITTASIGDNPNIDAELQMLHLTILRLTSSPESCHGLLQPSAEAWWQGLKRLLEWPPSPKPGQHQQQQHNYYDYSSVRHVLQMTSLMMLSQQRRLRQNRHVGFHSSPSHNGDTPVVQVQQRIDDMLKNRPIQNGRDHNYQSRRQSLLQRSDAQATASL